MSNLFALPKQTPVTPGGSIYSGAKAYFYLTGTSTPKNTYSDAALSTPHANPVIADSGGLFPSIFLDTQTGEYRVTLRTASDVLLYTQDNVGNRVDQSLITEILQSIGAQGLGQILFPRSAAEISAGVTPSNYSYEYGDIRRYGGLDDGTGTQTALVRAISVAAAGGPTAIKLTKALTLTCTIDSGNLANSYAVRATEIRGLEIIGAPTYITSSQVDTTLHAHFFQFYKCDNVVIHDVHVVATGAGIYDGVSSQAAPRIAVFRGPATGFRAYNISGNGNLGLVEVLAETIYNGSDAVTATHAHATSIEGVVINTIYGTNYIGAGAGGHSAHLKVYGRILRCFDIIGTNENMNLKSEHYNPSAGIVDTAVASISGNFQSNVNARRIRIECMGYGLNAGKAVLLDIGSVKNVANYAPSLGVVVPLIEDIDISGTFQDCINVIQNNNNTAIEAGATAGIIRRIRIKDFNAVCDKNPSGGIQLLLAQQPAGSTFEDITISNGYLQSLNGTPINLQGWQRVTISNFHGVTPTTNPVVALDIIGNSAKLSNCVLSSTSSSDHGVVVSNCAVPVTLANVEHLTSLGNTSAPTNWVSFTGSVGRLNSSYSGLLGDGTFLGTISSNLLSIALGKAWRLAPGAPTNLNGFSDETKYTNGATVALVFNNGNTTVVNGSGTPARAFLLRGAANTTPANGNVIVFRLDTALGLWIEISRNY